MPQYLKYELKYESGAWRYRLRLNDADDCLEFGKVTCKEEGVDVLYCIPKLTAYLQNSLSKCRDRARLQHLCISFRDELLLSEGNPYKAAVCIESPDKQAPHRVWATHALFSSLYLCFAATPDASSLIRVYAAWQRYNLIKHIIKDLSRTSQRIQDRVTYEFASAYRSLTSLLRDEANSYACRVLWAEGFKSQHTDQQKSIAIPDPQIRQRLRVSMFLDRELYKQEEVSEAPLPAPGYFMDTKKLKVISRISIAPFFQEHFGRIAIHRFTYEELLPGYDLKVALGLISQMKRGRLGRFLASSIQALLFITSCLLLTLVCLAGFNYAWINNTLPYLLFPSVILSILAFLFGMFALGSKGGISLLLPRITGGIVIGYFPLLIAAEPWYLALYSSRNHYTWFLEWGSILAISGLYLYREAYPFVLEGSEAFRRSFKVLVWATVQAALIGFLLILLSAPVYRQLTYNDENIDFQSNTKVSTYSEPEQNGASKESFQVDITQEPADSQKDFPNHDKRTDRNKPVETGLDYRVPIHVLRFQTEFPISALLTFAPISLLLGIILQILWEEKTVTASVWPTESR